ncbi:hypothetical protein AB5N19_00401 [Seiridium cardinale]|uniref:Uncharacterized protein n=1 Tax=Seiridium cardinale TaxID=138064 RepID=A0ABR2XX94_9PEZI
MYSVVEAPRKERYHKYKKRLYLEPPTNGSVTTRTRITTVVPPPKPIVIPQPEPEPVIVAPPPPPPPVIVAPPPPPPPPPAPEPVIVAPPPPPPPPPEDTIEVIAVDVDPSVKSHKSHKSSKSSRSSRSRSHSRVDSREREVYIEREKLVPVRVPVPYPVRAEPDYETFRYVDAPRRFEPRPRSHEREIIIEDRHRRHYHRD